MTIYKAEQLQIALGLSGIKMTFKSNNSTYESIVSGRLFTVNYTPNFSRFNLALTLRRSGYRGSGNVKYEESEYSYDYENHEHTWFIDTNYKYSSKYWFGFTIGSDIYNNIFDFGNITGKNERTLGLSLIRTKSFGFLSNFQIGFINYEIAGNQLVFKAAF